MANIYSGAHVVLAAMFPEGCTQGFLHTRPTPLATRFGEIGKSRVEVHATYNRTHDCWNHSHRNDLAIFKRAWCMQERFLAHRVLYFMQDEIHFQCQEVTLCEFDASHKSYVDPVKAEDIIGHYDPYALASTECFMLLQAKEPLESSFPMSFGLLWAGVVQEYSQLNLTYHEDILPALSAIAHEISQHHPGRYLAGLWQWDLAIQLAWQPFISSSDGEECSVERTRNPGPSVSWIS
jgi:hypothetical protein